MTGTITALCVNNEAADVWRSPGQSDEVSYRFHLPPLVTPWSLCWQMNGSARSFDLFALCVVLRYWLVIKKIKKNSLQPLTNVSSLTNWMKSHLTFTFLSIILSAHSRALWGLRLVSSPSLPLLLFPAVITRLHVDFRYQQIKGWLSHSEGKLNHYRQTNQWI